MSPFPFIILYITINGVSLDMFKVTWPERHPALENKFKYLEAKLRETGSSTSNTTDSFSFSASCWLKMALPVPISPVIPNLMFYFVVSIFMDSDKFTNYLHILENSPEGMVQIDVNSVSGIPIPSESIVIRDKLNSEIFSAPAIKTHFTFGLEFKFKF